MNSSLGACRSDSARPIAPRRNPEARFSPSVTSSGVCLLAKGTKKMRAVDISGATLTVVIVTLPTRGSRTSRDTSVDNTRCISPSMRPSLCDFALNDFPSLDAARDFHARVALDLIADAHVLVVLHADTALGAGTHFAGVVLEAAQGFQRALEDHHALAQHADRIVALDHAFGDQATRNHAELARAEYFAHLGGADDGFLDLGREQAGEQLLHVVDGFVNDAEVLDFDFVVLHGVARGRIGTHVEADDAGFRG